MQPAFNAPSIANLLSTTQGIFFAFVLVVLKRGNRLANIFLAAFLFAVAVNSFDDVLFQSGYILYVPWFMGIGAAHLFLVGPLFYLYVKTCTRPGLELRPVSLFHAIPFVLLAGYLAVMVLRSSQEEQLARVMQVLASQGKGIGVLNVVSVLHVLAYLIASVAEFAAYNVRLKNNFSIVGPFELRWVRRLLYMVAFLWLGLVVTMFFNVSLIDTMNPFFSPAFIYAVGFMGVLQQRRYPDASADFLSLRSINGGSGQQQKYAKSGLTGERKQEYLQRLRRIMEEEKPYRSGNLTLSATAERLSMSPNHLSQILNEELNQNFFDFINAYRVEEVKKELFNPAKANLTILAIAFEAGFNSKAAFNSAFKKHTRMTPSQYKNFPNEILSSNPS